MKVLITVIVFCQLVLLATCSHDKKPSDTSGHDPQFCNSSWKFNVTKIETLMTNLTLHWPNIYKGTSEDEFWAHEWKKHGTCATDDERILNEFGYFETALQIAQEYNITMALMLADVVSSITQTYSVKDFSSAVEAQFGVTPVVKCYFSTKTKKHLVSEIRLCLDRDFNTVECAENGPEDCPTNQDIHYMPMDVHFENTSNENRREL